MNANFLTVDWHTIFQDLVSELANHNLQTILKRNKSDI